MKKNPVWSLNQSFYGDSFEKSKTPSLQWGLEINPLNTPINKMGVTVSDPCDQSKKSQIFSIKKTDHIDL